MVSRAVWLGNLVAGDPVNLVTSCGIHQASIEGLRDHRLWVIWTLGYACEFGHSATWVDPLTGANNADSYHIEPCDLSLRETFND